MGNCGVRSKPHVSIPASVHTNPAVKDSLRVKLLEMKQAERVPVLSIERSKMYQRRLVRQETMAESWEDQGPVGKNL